MKNNNSYINPDNGNVSWNGELSIQKGDHSNMPYRTDAYLPGDERGHINASSLGGNSKDNVVAQNAELNHGAYYSMEQGSVQHFRTEHPLILPKQPLLIRNPETDRMFFLFQIM